MNFSTLEQVNNVINANQNSPTTQNQEALRQAAMQFEAVLLMQLTSALNNTNNDDENALFGGDGGTGLAKQMFSEQLATTMAQSGGIGLADVIMQQFGGTQTNRVSANANALSNVANTVRNIRENNQSQTTQTNQTTSRNNNTPLINRNGTVNPVTTETFTGDPNEFAVVSTFEESVQKGDYDPALNALMLDGKIQNTTRPRIVPNTPITQVSTVSTNNSVTNVSRVNNEALTYQIPVKGRISSNFGNRFHPIDKRMKFHAGMDIAAPTGTVVGATADGTVKFAGWRDGYGNLVIIEHADGRESRYGHLSKISVSQGDKVSGGQQIGLVGSTGKSTGPHLHFEIRENGQAVNPAKIMSNVLPKTAER